MFGTHNGKGTQKPLRHTFCLEQRSLRFAGPAPDAVWKIAIYMVANIKLARQRADQIPAHVTQTTHPTARLPPPTSRARTHPMLTGSCIADCFCGEGPPQGEPWKDECDIECEGPSSHYSCGGSGYVVFYDIPLPDTAPELQLTIGRTSKLLGCFPFIDNYQLLPGTPFTKPGRMTNEVGI